MLEAGKNLDWPVMIVPGQRNEPTVINPKAERLDDWHVPQDWESRFPPEQAAELRDFYHQALAGEEAQGASPMFRPA